MKKFLLLLLTVLSLNLTAQIYDDVYAYGGGNYQPTYTQVEEIQQDGYFYTQRIRRFYTTRPLFVSYYSPLFIDQFAEPIIWIRIGNTWGCQSWNTWDPWGWNRWNRWSYWNNYNPWYYNNWNGWGYHNPWNNYYNPYNNYYNNYYWNPYTFWRTDNYVGDNNPDGGYWGPRRPTTGDITTNPNPPINRNPIRNPQPIKPQDDRTPVWGGDRTNHSPTINRNDPRTPVTREPVLGSPSWPTRDNTPRYNPPTTREPVRPQINTPTTPRTQPSRPDVNAPSAPSRNTPSRTLPSQSPRRN